WHQNQCLTPKRIWSQALSLSNRRHRAWEWSDHTHAIPLRAASERLHTCWRAIDNTAFRRDHPSPLVPLDDLGDAEVAPWSQPGPSARARLHGVAKGLTNRPDVCPQPIGAKQQRTVRGTAADALNQLPDQGHVALLADLTA